MDAKKSDEGEAHESGIKTKIVGILAIAGLTAMVVLVGTVAANGGAEIYGSREFENYEQRHNFETTDNLWAWGDFGDYSYTFENPPCPAPDGCGGRVYVVEHQETWVNGTELTDVSGGFETLSWGDFYFDMAWPKPLTPGTYDLILDLNVSGHLGVWTNVTNPYPGLKYIADPIWTINVTGPSGPEISINKTVCTNGVCPGADPLTVDIGDTVTYCFNVTNTGNKKLTNVSLFDDHYGAITLGNDTLEPGESLTNWTVTYLVTESDIPSVINTATVNSTYDNKSVNDTDICTLNVDYNASIEINKTASISGSCPGSDPLNVSIGDTVTYCFNVTNIGDVTLENVAVFDDHYNEILLADTSLAPGEFLTNGTITHIVSELDIPSVTNNVSVDSTDPDNKPVNDSDNCTLIVGYNASIEIVKTVTKGSCPGSHELNVNIDDTVTYCFNVTNTGDVNITDIKVQDDRYGEVTLGTMTLEPGNSTGGTITHVVNESDIPEVTNTATVTGTSPGGTVTDEDSCTIYVDFNPGIVIDKTAFITGSCPGTDPLLVNIGDTVTYCFEVTNTGDVTLAGITVDDDIYGPVTLNDTTLGPGESTYKTLTHYVTEDDFPKVNTATVTGTDPLGEPVSDSDTCTINIEYRPGIEIIKTAFITGSCPGTDPLNVSIGDTVTYCFNVTNTGDVALTDITVGDDIYGPVELEMDMLDPGESLTNETITHIVSALDIPSVTNTATVNATYPDNKPVNDTDNCTITVDYNASIEIVKTAYISGSCPGTDPLTVHIGDFVTYCINVTNTGDATLANIMVTDDHYGVISLVNDTLAPGQSTGGTATHTVNESDRPSETNTATVNATDPASEPVNDTDTCTLNVGYNASIEIVKTAYIAGSCPGTDPLTVHIGDFVTYCFNVTNTGDATLTNVTVTDDHYGVISLVNDTLAPGQSTGGTATHTVTESDRPSETNTATVNATDPASEPVNNTDSCTIIVDYNAGIEVNKTASISGSCPGTDPLTVHIGDFVTYCFNVTNTGDATLTNITVNDDHHGVISLVNDTLAPGQSTGGTATHTVTESDRPSETNTATVNATDPASEPVNNTDSCTIIVDYNAGIEVNKTASISGSCPGTDPLTVHIGDFVTYCFNVTNTGDATLTNVTVTDDHYGVISLGTNTLAPGASLTNGTITHPVSESDIPSVTNTVTVNSTDPYLDAVNATDTCTLNVGYNASIEIDKTASTSGTCPGSDPLAVDVGDTVTYCFNVTNTGNVSLSNVTVSDDHYGVILLASTELAPGASLTNETITHPVTESDIPSVTNTVTVNSTDPYLDAVNATDTCTLNVGYDASIEIVKTAYTSGSCPGSDPLAVDVGDTVTYCFNVTNTGNVSLSNVTVSDDHYGVILFASTELAPGASLTNETITHPVTESDIPSVTNTVTVNSTDPYLDAVNATDTCTLNVGYNASIEIEKTASTSGTCPGSDPLAVVVGDTVTYCFNVTNTGNVTLSNITVWDDHHGTIVLTKTELEPDESTGGTTAHTVTKADIPSVTNTATVNATDPDFNPVNDTDNCTITVDYTTDIVIVKTASTNGVCPGTDPLTVDLGDTVTYCFSVTNTGNVTLSNITVWDDHHGTIVLTKTELEPDESTGGTTTHTVTKADIPSVTNTATVNATDPDNNPVNDTDNCTITVDYTTDIVIVKTASTNGVCPGTDPLAVDLGDTVTYCFNVTNTGNVTLSNITVWDDHHGTIVLTKTELAPDESTGGTTTHTVTKADIPSVTNTVTVNATDPDFNPVNDTDNCTITVDYTTDIVIVKTASSNGVCPGTDPLTVDLGDTVTYCFNVTNTGNVTLSNISVWDDHHGTIVLTKTELAPDESTGGTTTHPVTEADVSQVINNATVTGTFPSGEIVTDNDNCTINIEHPHIAVTKTVSPTSGGGGGGGGGGVRFTIGVTNTGDSTLDPVKVEDTLPAGMSYVEAGTSPAPSSVMDNIITWDIGLLNPLASSIITLAAHIESGVSGMLTNIVNVTGTSPTGYKVTDSATADVYVEPPAQVPEFTSVGLIALIGLLSVIAALSIKRRNE